MSNSTLVSYTKLSPCNSGTRTHKIDRITPHCVVGQASVESLGTLFQNYARQTSSNYGIGADGRIGLYVDESKRSWCSSSNANDQRAVTIECASATVAPYEMNKAVYESLVKLCVDICKRNGKTKLLWLGSKERTLAYTPKDNEIVLSAHRWFSAKSCPGGWLYSRFGDLAETVTKELAPKKLYRVQVGAFTNPDNATAFSKELQRNGFNNIVKVVHMNGAPLYRVQVGAFTKIENAERQKKELEKCGYNAVITEVEM